MLLTDQTLHTVVFVVDFPNVIYKSNIYLVVFCYLFNQVNDMTTASRDYVLNVCCSRTAFCSVSQLLWETLFSTRTVNVPHLHQHEEEQSMCSTGSSIKWIY